MVLHTVLDFFFFFTNQRSHSPIYLTALHRAQVKNDTIVEVWLPKWQNEFAKVTSKGYRTLLTSTFYLNRVASPYGQDWKGYYGVDPQDFNGKNGCVRWHKI